MQSSKSRMLFRHVRRLYCTLKHENIVENQHSISKQLHGKIKATGPIPIAEYMKEVLINPNGGYYMNKNVFGKSGDFITSPELSQMFGEMIAIWCLNEWSKTGCPKPFQIVELGPGLGSLSQDILRVFQKFEALKGCNLSLVEVSPFLSNSQAETLCETYKKIENLSSPFYQEGTTSAKVNVKWYRNIRDIPNIFSIVIAHEYFDALPIHQFQKTDLGYREILIDNSNDIGTFRYVMARNETPASKLYIKPNESRDRVEVSPESCLTVKIIAEKLKSYGGIALIADYGHTGNGTDTFRAFRKHKLHNPLIEPGTADLTADVDFGRLKEEAAESNHVLVFGPISQRKFLLNMGIEHRFEALKNKAKQDQLEALKFSYDMMLDAKQMGERFKFISLMPAVLKNILDKFPVVGFG